MITTDSAYYPNQELLVSARHKEHTGTKDVNHSQQCTLKKLRLPTQLLMHKVINNNKLFKYYKLKQKQKKYKLKQRLKDHSKNMFSINSNVSQDFSNNTDVHYHQRCIEVWRQTMRSAGFQETSQFQHWLVFAAEVRLACRHVNKINCNRFMGKTDC